MKFTDGNWMMQPGVKAHYPAEAYEAEIHGETLELYVPTRHIRHRGDTLEGPVLTVQLTSPLPEVIRVKVAHFTGGHDAGPSFPLMPTTSAPKLAVDESIATITSGKLTATIDRKNWSLEFWAESKLVTKSPARGMGYVKTENGAGPSFVHEQLSLGVGECVYGLGERFTGFVKNGQVVEMWNQDGGTGSDQAYKNVPFYLTNRGYGVFVNQPERVSFEVASEKVSRVQFSVPGESLEYFVIYGPTPKEILEKYTALTGRAALPPAWTFGLWLTTSFTTSYDEATVNSFLDGMAERDLPLSVFHFDCFWMRGFRWCDFEWDPAVFPDPEAMLARLHERGLKVCVWINSYIAQRSPLFEEAKEKGFLLKRTDGSVWQWDLWQPGMGIVDFTNPAACDWFAAHLKRLVAMGVDSFKTDFGERIPTDGVAWYDGSDPQKMHNFYPYLYNKVTFDALQEAKGEAALFARSATAGCQQFPVHWGGDCYSSFESMAESLRGGLSLGLSGFGFWSHDIGGFEGKPPTEVYKRWLAFGLLSSHSRLHGSSSYRVPWLFDDEAVDVCRHFTRLKCQLMPYLFQKAVEATQIGLPLMRAMVLEFPDDPACETLDRQYLLGESLLVAPVFRADNVVDFYLPDGIWTNFFTGEQKTGGRWYRETHDFFSLPLYVREGAVLALSADQTRPDGNWVDGLTLHAYGLRDGQSVSVTVPNHDGTPALTATVTRTGETVTAKGFSGMVSVYA